MPSPNKEREMSIYYYRGAVERLTNRGYVWRDGYSANGENGGTLYPWVTKREAQAHCKAIGMRAVFVPSKGPIECLPRTKSARWRTQS